MKPEVIRGLAVNVRHNENVSGSNGQISTTYICVFTINERWIKIESNTPIYISECDNMELSGYAPKNAFFDVYGYNNLSQRIYSHGNYKNLFKLGMFFVLLGGFLCAIVIVEPSGTVLLFGIFVIPALLGCYLIKRAYDGIEAIKLINGIVSQ